MKKYNEFNEEVADFYEKQAESWRREQNIGLYILIGCIIALTIVTVGLIISILVV